MLTDNGFENHVFIPQKCKSFDEICVTNENSSKLWNLYKIKNWNIIFSAVNSYDGFGIRVFSNSFYTCRRAMYIKRMHAFLYILDRGKNHLRMKCLSTHALAIITRNDTWNRNKTQLQCTARVQWGWFVFPLII